AVWAATPDDLYVGGWNTDAGSTPALYHWNGANWVDQTINGLFVTKLYGRGANDVYVLGIDTLNSSATRIWRNNGGGWSMTTPCRDGATEISLQGLGGMRGGSVVAAGYSVADPTQGRACWLVDGVFRPIPVGTIP